MGIANHRAMGVWGSDDVNAAIAAVEHMCICRQKSSDPIARLRPCIAGPLQHLAAKSTGAHDQDPAHVGWQGSWADWCASNRTASAHSVPLGDDRFSHFSRTNEVYRANCVRAVPPTGRDYCGRRRLPQRRGRGCGGAGYAAKGERAEGRESKTPGMVAELDG